MQKFVQLKEALSIDGSTYTYAERLGVDSVAFIIYDVSRADGLHFGLINEFKPPIQEWMDTAFGGSLDKDLHPDRIVKEEVLEEAGYEVEDHHIYPLGRVFVSTQMNQFCHLYFVEVSQKQFVGRRPENESEAAAKVVWKSYDQILVEEDWKAATILTKAAYEGLILIESIDEVEDEHCNVG